MCVGFTIQTKRILVFVFAATSLFAAVFFSPKYLFVSNNFEKSSAVILFLGPDYEARKKEAYVLLQDGFAEFLLVPACFRIKRARADGSLEPVKTNRITLKSPWEYRSLYENTHLEVLWARQMMDAYGFKSCIFVSSPQHMRRIKIMADRVFDKEEYRLSFVPTRYEDMPGSLWWTSVTGLKKVVSEYVKIAWFLMYEPFLGR